MSSVRRPARPTGSSPRTPPLSPPRITAWRPEDDKRVLDRAVTGEGPVVVMPGLGYGRSGGLAQSFFVEPARTADAVPCIGDGSNHWALVHVHDIAELYVLAGSVCAGGQNLPLTPVPPEPSATPPAAGTRPSR